MNNPNPFIPQGSLLEQHKRRSRMKLAVFCIVAASIAGLSAMLIQGCKREQTADNNPPVDTNNIPVETNVAPIEASNPPVVVPPLPTNQPIVTPQVTPVVPQIEATEYVVVKGDTFGKIAKAHGISLKALEDANSGVTPTKLKIGQKLQIPAGGNATSVPNATSTSTSTDMSGGGTYVVKSGDTLSKIAKVNGVSLKALKAANPNVDPNHIKVGQKLNIPAKAESAPAAAPLSSAPATSPAPAVTPSAQNNPPTGQ